MAALGKSGNPTSLGLSSFLRLHRLPKAIALAVHLEYLRVMGQSVQESRRHPLPLEDLVPLAERQVARHQDTAALVAVGEDPEQEFDPATAHRDVSQLVADQQVGPIELGQEAIKCVLLLLLFESVDQFGRREEPHPQTRPTGGKTESNGNMCLSSSVAPDEAAVRLLGDPLAPRQLKDLRLGQVWHRRE